MLKLTLLFRRAPELSRDEFLAYWRDVHIPLVKQVPNIVRYTVSPVVDSPDTERPAFDGMAELYFRSRDDLDVALASPETAATARDGRRFLERGSIVRIVTEEEQVLPEVSGTSESPHHHGRAR